MPRKRMPPKSGRVAVRILRDHDHKLTPGMVLAFKAGTEDRVAPTVAQALYAAGAAEPQTDTTIEPLTGQTED